MDMKDVDQKEKNKDLKKIQFVITLIMVMSISITGATYAFFAVSANNTTTINGTAASVNLTLNVTKVFPASGVTNTGVMVPQLTGTPLQSALTGDYDGDNATPTTPCVDANGNIACQVYKINIQNVGGTATQVVDGTLDFYYNSDMTGNIAAVSGDNDYNSEKVMPNLRWKLITSTTTIGSDADRIAKGGVTYDKRTFSSNLKLATSGTQDYYIIVWINETNNAQEDYSINNTTKKRQFFGKVEFKSSNGTGVTSTFTS